MAIVVVNNTDTEFIDRFNGQDFVFAVGKKVLLNEEAALHIFGFGAEDKTPYLTRQGWMKTTGEYDRAMQNLGKFSFSLFDPYAQLDDPVQAADQQEQQLSPVAPASAEASVSDGAAASVQASPSFVPGGILAKLQGA